MLSRIFSKLSRVGVEENRRLANVAKIEELGFKLVDLRGWHEGDFAVRRYHLVDDDGTVYDNDGTGYRSSADARRAAEKLREASNP